jgi:hypothetical protein
MTLVAQQLDKIVKSVEADHFMTFINFTLC